MSRKLDFARMANAIRSLSMDAVQNAKSGHPGIVLGMADVISVLFAKFLKFYADNQKWPDRDRFILSAGHGSMLLYSVLYLTGAPDITIEDIKNFRQYGSKTAGHPEYGLIAGIENTSGPLAQGLGNAVGMAVAEAVLAAKFGSDLIDHYTYVVVGDGCLMEGLGYESVSFAGHLGLGKLIVLFDNNSISIDGDTNLACSENHLGVFEACGWHVIEIDGHSYQQIEDALVEARANPKPSLISCRTIIGKFLPKQGTESTHSGAVSNDELVAFKKAINASLQPFAIDDDVLELWRGLSDYDSYNAWSARFNSLDLYTRELFLGRINVLALDSSLSALKKVLSEKVSEEATRSSSGSVLEVLIGCVDNLLGGSADLTQSNCCKAASMKAIAPGDFAGNYIHYGVREHLMAACMNGIALHGGMIPYGGTFFVFTDYCRPAIRLSALMGVKVIYVMTHDSIGVGEDGPTHQPVEHLASLRAMPGLYVIRPADAVETIEAWQLALQVKGPVILVLSRQKVMRYRNYSEENLVARGAYIIVDDNPVGFSVDVIMFASGSELGIIIKARQLLKSKHNGIMVRVVSVPCWELFFEQSGDYIATVIDNNALKVAVEASSFFGWDRFIGKDGVFVGMRSFGESAPFQNLYEHFKITPEEVVHQCERYLGL